MASLSPAAAQIRVLHGGGTSSSKLFIKQRSSKHSNGVSFGVLPPRSSFPTLKSSCNGFLPVAAVGNGGATRSLRDDENDRFTLETLTKIVKERVYRFAGTSITQLPDGAADKVHRLAMEAAKRLAKVESEIFDTQFSYDDAAYAAYVVAFKRILDEEAKRISKEAAHMFASGTGTHLPDDAANEVERSVEEAANNTFAASETQRLAVGTLARLLKERAERFAGTTSTQLPDASADEIARLAMEAAATLFMTSRDKFERISTQFPDNDTKFFDRAAAIEYAVEYERFLRKEAKRIAKDVANMFAGTSTQLPDADANEVKRSVEEPANNTFSASEAKEKKSEGIDAENHAVSSEEKWSRYEEAMRLAIEAAEKLAKETANILEGDSKQLPDAADDEAERLAVEAAEKLVKETADMVAGASIQLQKLVEEAAKMFAADDRKDDNNEASAAVAGLADEVSGLIKPYLTRVQDSYDVGDYIWTRIGSDKIEGEVISKDYNVTRLKVPYQRITVIDNHKLGWVDVLQK